MRIIGAADEFWRLRMTRVDAPDGLDFEWHPDILYRKPQPSPVTETESWHIEAVRLDDFETVVRIASFDEREAAESYMDRAKEDLVEMTKSQFEESYLSGGDDDELAEEGL